MTHAIRSIRRNPVISVAIFTLLVGAALLFAVPASAATIYDTQFPLDTGDMPAFGHDAAFTRVAQSFTSTNAATQISAEVALRKDNTNTLTDDVRVTLWSDSSGQPGSPVSGWSEGFVIAHTTTTSFQYFQATLIGPALSPSTKYWLVFERTGSPSGTNYYRVERHGSSDLDPAQEWWYFDSNTTTWNFGDTRDFNMKIDDRVGEPLYDYLGTDHNPNTTSFGVGNTNQVVASRADLNGPDGLTVEARICLTDPALTDGVHVKLVGNTTTLGGNCSGNNCPDETNVIAVSNTVPASALPPTPGNCTSSTFAPTTTFTISGLPNPTGIHWLVFERTDPPSGSLAYTIQQTGRGALGPSADAYKDVDGWARWRFTTDWDLLANPTATFTRYHMIRVDEVFDGPQEIKVAVILAEPDESVFALDVNDRSQLIERLGNVEDYWCEVSFGVRDPVTDKCDGGIVDLDFTVLPESSGRYQLTARSLASYGENTAEQSTTIADNFGNETLEFIKQDDTGLFAWDAINLAEQQDNPDFGQYDVVLVLHPEHSEDSFELNFGATCSECLVTGAFWFAELRPDASTDSAERARRWVVVSEFEEVGVIAHEIGHVLNLDRPEDRLDAVLPDLYQGSFTTSDIGPWGLMGDGNNLGTPLGSSPVHLTAFSKQVLGWLIPQSLIQGTHTIESTESKDLDDPAERYAIGGDSYYQLEARTNQALAGINWNVETPGDALVIYRVDPLTPTPEEDYVVQEVAVLGEFGVAVDKVRDVAFNASNFQFLSDKFELDVEISQYSPATSEIVGFFNPTNVLASNVLSGATRINKVEPPEPEDAVSPVVIEGPSSTNPYESLRRERNNDFLSLLWYRILPFGLLAALFFVVTQKARLKLSKYIRLIGVVAAILFAVLALVFLAQALIQADFFRPIGPRSASAAELTFADPLLDTDLHAYDDQGNHVGVNYETGEYEINIPGAESSGDLFMAEEWISVPEGTNVKFEVFSEDIDRFFEENPDIAASLPSLEETYEFGAVTYDANGTRYEATPVQDIAINPGEVIVHDVGGTTENPTVDAGTVDDQGPAITRTALNASYLLNSPSLTFDYSADDALSGLASVSATLNGSPITSGTTLTFDTVGDYQIVITADDNAGNVTTETIDYSVVYDFVGFLSPIKNDGSGIYKQGRTLPVKFELFDVGGTVVSDAVNTLVMTFIDSGISGTEEVALSTSAADTGNQFRFDEETQQYIFNLDTSPMDVGTWDLHADLADGTRHTVQISIRD